MAATNAVRSRTEAKRAEDMTSEELRALLPAAQGALEKAEGEVGISDDELHRRAVEAVLAPDGEAKRAELRLRHGAAIQKRDECRLTAEGLERAIAEAADRERKAQIMGVHDELLKLLDERIQASREVQAAIDLLARWYVKVENFGIDILRAAVRVPALNPRADPADAPLRDPDAELPSAVYDEIKPQAAEPDVKRVRRFRVPGYLVAGFRGEQTLEQMLSTVTVAVMTARGGDIASRGGFAQEMRNWQSDLLREFRDHHEREHPRLFADRSQE